MQYHFQKTYSDKNNLANACSADFQTYTAAELARMPKRIARDPLPGLIADGVTLLAGMPKQGKSRIASAIATAIATGTPFAGRMPARTGRVLFLALEERKEFYGERLRSFYGKSARDITNFDVRFDLNGFPDENAAYIDAWIAAHSDAALVVIDVWQAFIRNRPSARTYAQEYQLLSLITDISRRRDVPILIVTHVIKAGARSNALTAVAGTLAMVAAPDSTLVMRNTNGTIEIEAHSRMMQGGHFSFRFLEGAGWTEVTGSCDAPIVAPGRSEQVLALFGTPDTVVESKTICDAVFAGNANAANAHLSRMVRDGELQRQGRGKYRLPD